MFDRLKKLLKFGRSFIFCGFILGICGIFSVIAGLIMLIGYIITHK